MATKSSICRARTGWTEISSSASKSLSPILDPKLRRRVLKEGLKAYLLDNSQAWELDGSDGKYHRKTSRTTRRAAQTMLLDELTSAV